ncbi:MAG: DJ-1/PfpI family protein [Verrucomicrobia bacterium]|nr:DJ-1/PfpI family protein [Verrucomicrobiota bacterium]MBV9658768.1 DJ-1/PfpI family protein [Verrucomicrobiota bacterium]
METRKTVGILVFPEVEVLDFCGPFEVFSVARLDEAHRRETESPFLVLLISHGGVNNLPVRACGGLRVLPDCGLDDCPPLDVLLVPGGWGTRALLGDAALSRWLRERAKKVEMLLSVCTGALLLGKAGLLDGRRATTHWRSLDALAQVAPLAEIVRDEHVVQTAPNFLTSAGIAAGIDLALQAVAHFHGDAIARATARYMEYPFPEENRRRV